MWCSSSDNPGNHRLPEPHHRIVRIPPGEAVVLNSAERAPYLLLIEVLVGDLDFDPVKRANKEVLRKVVTKQVENRGPWIDFGLSSSGLKHEITADPDRAYQTPFTSAQSTFLGVPPTAASSTFSNDDEEMDLVEQLYGVDQPLRSRILDVEDSIVIPPTPKNRELDMVAWSRSSPSLSQSPPGDTYRRQGSVKLSGLSPSIPPQNMPPTFENESAAMLSMDEYSDRMRTAAIMLAQLNADHSRDSGPVPYKSNGSSRIDNPSDHTGKSSRVFCLVLKTSG